MKKKKVKKRGGARPGSGRKPNPTDRITLSLQVGVLAMLGGKQPVRRICQAAIQVEVDKKRGTDKRWVLDKEPPPPIPEPE